MTEYYIGQIFDNPYPVEAAYWCNHNNCSLEDYEENKTIIIKNPSPSPKELEANFKASFFNIQGYGWYRKQPKGYQSAVESMNVLYNMADRLDGIPQGLIIFYEKPDFTKPEECKEEWLVQHQLIQSAMTKEAFMRLYETFITAWNTQEHEE